MRYVLILSSAISLSFIVMNGAVAAPVPPVGAASHAPEMITTIDYWRRYWRRHGGGPVVVVPDAETAPVVEETLPPPPPPRPLSCGEFHYWNGQACADARYNNPYLGPK
jgi:hypothetical protein